MKWAIAAAVVRFSQSIERYGRLGGDVHKTEPKEDIFTLLVKFYFYFIFSKAKVNSSTLYNLT